jgi:hypothetical protein
MLYVVYALGIFLVVMPSVNMVSTFKLNVVAPVTNVLSFSLTFRSNKLECFSQPHFFAGNARSMY